MTTPPDGLVTTEQAAALLDVPAARIRAWKTRRRVVPAGVLPGRGRHRGAPLYRLDELQPLAQAYHQQRATRRASDQHQA